MLTAFLAIANDQFVIGDDYKILGTQEVEFVPLDKKVRNLFKSKKFKPILDLKPFQTSVKSQGGRGACTYFVAGALVESILKMSLKTDFDLSEEYIAWAAKTKSKLRSDEEDSSVVVNLKTIQDYGFMVESDLIYQPSWFSKGMPCEGKVKVKNEELKCYAHNGPQDETKINKSYKFKFYSINSSSYDVVKALNLYKTAVTTSIKAHHKTWEESSKTGRIILTSERKTECENKSASCSTHAVLITGYDLKKREFYFKNSWGTDWGIEGYGSISFDYMDQLSKRKFMTGIKL